MWGTAGVYQPAWPRFTSGPARSSAVGPQERRRFLQTQTLGRKSQAHPTPLHAPDGEMSSQRSGAPCPCPMQAHREMGTPPSQHIHTHTRLPSPVPQRSLAGDLAVALIPEVQTGESVPGPCPGERGSRGPASRVCFISVTGLLFAATHQQFGLFQGHPSPAPASPAGLGALGWADITSQGVSASAGSRSSNAPPADRAAGLGPGPQRGPSSTLPIPRHSL